MDCRPSRWKPSGVAATVIRATEIHLQKLVSPVHVAAMPFSFSREKNFFRLKLAFRPQAYDRPLERSVSA